MPAYSVDSDAVLTATAQVHATAERIRAETEALLGQLLHLQSSWQGGAASAFHGTIEQWRATQRTVEEALASIGQALGVAGAQYAETEHLTAGMFR
ncbi:WXG100 family type VII secretion target [Microbacterium album]|uniref:ESAT-6-like protein n=1 Tax=Microbacterium album TaxID=2053191 RepID=A0A917IH98_9MICO|nr:WXG100 family type VII secretion target [Microbacterium album]GGH43806.1 hypothetical protein GCM10010921_18050 [Microbacterium album]